MSLILDFLASGWSTSEILEIYPGLEEADIRACIAYGAEMSRERYVEIGGLRVLIKLDENLERKGHAPQGAERTCTAESLMPGDGSEGQERGERGTGERQGARDRQRGTGMREKVQGTGIVKPAAT